MWFTLQCSRPITPLYTACFLQVFKHFISFFTFHEISASRRPGSFNLSHFCNYSSVRIRILVFPFARFAADLGHKVEDYTWFESATSTKFCARFSSAFVLHTDFSYFIASGNYSRHFLSDLLFTLLVLRWTTNSFDAAAAMGGDANQTSTSIGFVLVFLLCSTPTVGIQSTLNRSQRVSGF